MWHKAIIVAQIWPKDILKEGTTVDMMGLEHWADVLSVFQDLLYSDDANLVAYTLKGMKTIMGHFREHKLRSA